MIVGTAGHIDHGKTSLVRALTGIDTDRLKEEKARGISIDLGFAYLGLPDGGVLGFVDVPGHERLVHTMIAGAASIDYALLVVAADDGVMPQTREHVAVLRLLGVTRGAVAITKTDLVDIDRYNEVELEVAALLATTPLAGSDIRPVSCATGAGIEALRRDLLAAAEAAPAVPPAGAFRLAVDRSFTLDGVGTVVTGSVVAGSAQAGDAVRVLPRGVPGGLDARVRSLRVENRPGERASAGHRCALNLAGPDVSKDAVARGDWVVATGRDAVSVRCDARLDLLPTETAPLRSGAIVHVHHGAADLMGRIILLDAATIAPGAAAMAQIVADTARPFRTGDRLILRDGSAQRTIAGGRVLDPAPPLRHRSTPARLAILRATDAEAGAEAGAAAALRALLSLPPGVLDLARFAADRGLTDAEGEALAAATPGILPLAAGPSRYVTTEPAAAALRRSVEAAVAAHHAAHPEAASMPLDRLRRAIEPALPREALAALVAHLAKAGALRIEAGGACLPSHQTRLGGADAEMWGHVSRLLSEQRFKPPRVRDMAASLRAGEPAVRRACKLFARLGRLVEVVPDHFFLRDAVAEMAHAAQALSLATDGAFTAAQFRDRLGNGRGLAIQVLEHFDRRGLTARRGDLRRVVKDPAATFGAVPDGAPEEASPGSAASALADGREAATMRR